MRNLFITLLLFSFKLGFSQILVPYRVGDLWGYSDTFGKIKVKPQYQLTEFIYDEIGFAMKDSTYYIVNRKGKIISEGFKNHGNFVNGLCPIQKLDGSFYYINEKGEMAFNTRFDAAENFSEGRAIVSIKKKLGIINDTGGWVRVPNFDTSSVYFKSGFVMAISKGKYFYIDRNGKTLNLADSVSPAGVFSEGLAPVYVTKSRNSEGKLEPTTFLEFIDSTGNIVLSHFDNFGIDYSEYIALEKEFRDGKAIVKTRNELSWDYYFLDKKKRFSPSYSAARQLGDSLFLGAIGFYMAEIQLLDTSLYVAGQFQSKPTQVGEYSCGLLPFRNNDGYWGYCNSNCYTVVENKYSVASNFYRGFAAVVLNGRQGYINTRGVEFFREN